MNASDVHVVVYRWCTRSTQWHMILCCISAMVDGTSALRAIVNGPSAIVDSTGTSASWDVVSGISAMVDGTSASRTIVSGPSAIVDGTGTSASSLAEPGHSLPSPDGTS